MANASLQQQLALLYQLQARDTELLSLHQKLQEIPRQIEHLKTEVLKNKEHIAAKSAELAETERAQRAKNAELETNAAQREKFQTEQRSVTSNEAYTAFERQIEFLDREDEKAEDTLLELMEDSDRLKAELATLEDEVAREKENATTQTSELRQEQRALETEHTEKLAQRKAFLPKINPELRDKYHRWMKAQLANQSRAARANTGFVALGKNGTCGSCRIAIQPQTLKEAQKYQKPVYCSSCKRLLYVEPATPDIPFP